VQTATQADAGDATCDLVAGGSGADGGDGRPGLARGTTARGAGGGPNARGAGGGAGGAITGGGRAVRSGAGAAPTCAARSPALPVVERLEPSSPVELSVTVGVEISASPPRI
jgi:hypothetical protein